MPISTRTALRGILALQVGLAGGLLAVDFREILPRIPLPGPSSPDFSEPILPGDQTRRFTPSGPLVLPGRRKTGLDTSDQPSRLLFETGEGETLRLTGQVAPGDADRFAQWITSRTDALAPLPRAIILDSSGGSVADALQIGRQIRALDLPTEMGAEDICLSACPYMLVGGTTRSLHENARVGVHQHYFGESYIPAFLAVNDIQRSQAEVLKHLGEMGVDPALMVAAMSTEPEDIYLLLPAQIRDWNIATSPKDEADAEAEADDAPPPEDTPAPKAPPGP